MFEQIDSAIGFASVMLLLSLLIMAVVQALITALDLRAYNLHAGIVKLLKQIVPELRKPTTALAGKSASLRTMADEVADAIVKHPSLQVGVSRLKAIRRDELIKVLDDLASDSPMQPNAISPAAQKALSDALAPAVPGGNDTLAAAQLLANVLSEKYPTIHQELNQAAQKVKTVRKLEQETEAWFDAVMERTSDEFVRHTKMVTIGVTAALVLALQIDAGDIWTQISTSPELRGSLVRMADTTTSDADRTLSQDTRVKTTFDEIARTHPNEPDVAKLGGAPSTLVTCQQGESWIQTTVPQFSDEFRTNCRNKVVAAVGDAGKSLQEIGNQLVRTQLHIVYKGLALRGAGTVSIWAEALRQPAHLLGIVASLILLSLGAPFWFNTLRELANLKPVVASKIQNESLQDANAGSA